MGSGSTKMEPMMLIRRLRRTAMRDRVLLQILRIRSYDEADGDGELLTRAVMEADESADMIARRSRPAAGRCLAAPAVTG